MGASVWMGTLLVLAGGAMTGSFALPMKYARRWEWENVWLVYSVVGLLLLPWAAADFSVPDLAAVYGSVPAATLWRTALFGFGWGVANVLFGLSVAAVGMALTFAIVAGLSAACGSLVPLVLLTPERLGAAGGRMVLVGVALTVLGVAALGAAGRTRELAPQEPAARAARSGLWLAIAAGLLGPMLNFSFAFGSAIAESAARHGAGVAGGSNAIWALGLLGGFAGNGGYAALRLIRNGTWRKFRKFDAALEWGGSAAMGLLFTSGFLFYGRGATLLGALGPAVGWPVFQATTILVSTAAGAAAGEWRSAPRRFLRLTAAGLILLVAAIVVLSFGNRM